MHLSQTSGSVFAAMERVGRMFRRHFSVHARALPVISTDSRVKLKARGHQRGVQIDGRSRLYLDVDLNDSRRQVLSVENPAAAIMDFGDALGHPAPRS